MRSKPSDSALVVGIETPAQKRDSLRCAGKALDPGAGVGAAGIPAEDVEATVAERVEPIGIAPAPGRRRCRRDRPGSMNIVPIRSSGLLARWRISARRIVRPLGRSQSSGTRIVAHCRSSPGGSHTPQAIGAPTPFARGARSGASAPAALPAEIATRHAPPNAAAARNALRTESATRPVVDEFVEIPSGYRANAEMLVATTTLVARPPRVNAWRASTGPGGRDRVAELRERVLGLALWHLADRALARLSRLA